MLPHKNQNLCVVFLLVTKNILSLFELKMKSDWQKLSLIWLTGLMMKKGVNNYFQLHGRDLPSTVCTQPAAPEG